MPLTMRRTSEHFNTWITVGAATAIALFVSLRDAFAADEVHDEIKVYNAEIAT